MSEFTRADWDAFVNSNGQGDIWNGNDVKEMVLL